MHTFRTRFLMIAALVLILDHAAKYVVSMAMSPGDSMEIIPGYLRLAHVRNFGVAFGLFSDPQSVWKPYLLAAMAIVAIIVILVYSSRMPGDRLLLQCALAATMGGILGNFTDRLLRGSVVDFIEVHVNDSFHWPTFNLADSAITVGIALLLLDALRHPEKEVSGPSADPLSE